MPISEFELRQRHKTLTDYLKEEYALVHFIPSTEGVDIPDYLRTNKTVTLKLSFLFRGRLKIEETKAQAELLFGDSYYNCVIPLEAIWGITSAQGKNMVWPEIAPPEILKEMSNPPKPRGSTPKATKNKKAAKVSYLKRVK